MRTVLVYPVGFKHELCPCDACRYPNGRVVSGKLVGYGNCKRATSIEVADEATPAEIETAAAVERTKLPPFP